MPHHPGDDALAALATARGRALLAYAYLLTGDAATAEDLVQEAMLKVFVRGRTGFVPDVAEAYVRRTILRLTIDGARRRHQWSSVRHLFTRAETQDGPEDASTRYADLRAALATLAPQERACLVLRFYDDLTVPEIADRMGLSPGSVKRYLSNATAKLERRLGPLDVPGGPAPAAEVVTVVPTIRPART